MPDEELFLFFNDLVYSYLDISKPKSIPKLKKNKYP